MARVPDLIEFCQVHGVKMLTVAELIRYRMQHERYVHRVGEALVNTHYGEFRVAECDRNALAAEIARLEPSEIVVSDALYGDGAKGDPATLHLDADATLTGGGEILLILREDDVAISRGRNARDSGSFDRAVADYASPNFFREIVYRLPHYLC